MKTGTVHWFLFGSETTGSSRIHGFAVHRYLQRQGFGTLVALAPPRQVEVVDIPWRAEEWLSRWPIAQGDVVLFETLRGPRTIDLARTLSQRGVACVFIECDLNASWEIAAECAAIVCSSEFLRVCYARRFGSKVRCIPDALELLVEPGFKVRTVTANLKLGWIGHRLAWKHLAVIHSLLKQSRLRDFELVTVSDHPEARIPWTIEGAMESLKRCDIAILPTGNTDWDRAKSNNRATQAMALGLPVVAGGIPAYEQLIHHGQNGFLCTDEHEWATALTMLRDPGLRQAIAGRAYQLVRREFTMSRIGPLWTQLLADVSAAAKSRPPIQLRQVTSGPTRSLLQAQKYEAFAMAYVARGMTRSARRWGLVAASLYACNMRVWKAMRVLRGLWLRNVELLWFPRRIRLWCLRRSTVSCGGVASGAPRLVGQNGPADLPQSD